MKIFPIPLPSWHFRGRNPKKLQQKLCRKTACPKKYYSFVKDVDVQGIKCIVSRTGYTGEFGYEFYCAAADGPKLWDILLEAGKEFGLIPCGLGARDTLRLEAAMPLYGHELTDDITPLEAGLDFFVKLGKDCFIGMDAILAKGDPKVIRVGLKLPAAVLRASTVMFTAEKKKFGVVTSGTHCPYLNAPVAMAMVPASYAEPGTKVQVDVRGRRIDAEVVAPADFINALENKINLRRLFIMNIPNDVCYTKSHEWVKFAEDGSATVGLTDYAQNELGDLVLLTCPCRAIPSPQAILLPMWNP